MYDHDVMMHVKFNKDVTSNAINFSTTYDVISCRGVIVIWSP